MLFLKPLKWEINSLYIQYLKFCFFSLFLVDFLRPKAKKIKLNKANIGAAGINNIEDINGCHINPEQSKTSNAEQGSTYRLIIDSVI